MAEANQDGYSARNNDSDSSTTRGKGKDLQHTKSSRRLPASPAQVEARAATTADRVHGSDQPATPLEDTDTFSPGPEESPPRMSFERPTSYLSSNPDSLPDIASLAISVANDAEPVDNEDIPPLDLGEPFSVERSSSQLEEQENRPPTALRDHQDGFVGDSSPDYGQRREPTEDREPVRVGISPPLSLSSSSENPPVSSRLASIVPDIEHSTWSPSSFLRRTNAIRGRSSASSSEKAEILTAAVQQLRRVRFPKRAGDGHYVDTDDTEGVDGHTSSAPMVHARTIDIKPRRPCACSPAATAIIAQRESTNDSQDELRADTWEDAVAAADRRYEAEHTFEGMRSHGALIPANPFGMDDIWQQAETVIRDGRALGQLPVEEFPARGQRLITLADGHSVSTSVSAIPLDYTRARQAATPSINSHGSSFDDSSPLCLLPRKSKDREAFPKSPRQKLRAVSLQMMRADKLSLRDRVVGWLKSIASPGSEIQTESTSSPRSFKVWNAPDSNERVKKRHGRIFGFDELRVSELRSVSYPLLKVSSSLRRCLSRKPLPNPVLISEGRLLTSKLIQDLQRKKHTLQEDRQVSSRDAGRKTALKDVTNLRQPGYLQYNSFAKEFRSAAGSRAVPPSVLPVSDAGPRGCPTSVFEQGNHPNPLAQHPASGKEHIETVHAQLEGYVVRDSPPPQKQSPAAGSHATPQTPRRKAVTEDPLARLEGRMAPLPTSPLPSYLRSPAVALSEHKRSSTGKAQVLRGRSSWTEVLEDWKANADSLQRRVSVKPPVSVHSHHGLLDGPRNTTPGRGHWFYDAEETYGRN